MASAHMLKNRSYSVRAISKTDSDFGGSGSPNIGAPAAVPHEFKLIHFNKPTWCGLCTKFIWGLGKQGYCCKKCKYPAHKTCWKQVESNCGQHIDALGLPKEKAMETKMRKILESADSKYFVPDEVAHLYQEFRSTFGESSTKEHVAMYFNRFPEGLKKHFTQLIFSQITDEQVSFEHWLGHLAISTRGTLDERLDLVFCLCDKNGYGSVDRGDVKAVIDAVSEFYAGLYKGLIDDEESFFTQRALVALSIFSESDETLSSEEFKKRAMSNYILMNLIAITEIVLGTQVSRMQAVLQFKPKVFERELITFGEPVSASLPAVFAQPCEYLMTRVNQQASEGIFRVTGELNDFILLKDLYEKGEEVNLNELDVHTLIAGRILKTFVRQLPEPLLTFTLFDSFIVLADGEEQFFVSSVTPLLAYLPTIYLTIILELLGLLQLIAQSHEVNRMNAHNLAVIFAPSFLRPKGEDPEKMLEYGPKTVDFVTLLIDHATEIRRIFETRRKERRHTTDSLFTVMTLMERNAKLSAELDDVRYAQEEEVNRLNNIIERLEDQTKGRAKQ